MPCSVGSQRASHRSSPMCIHVVQSGYIFILKGVKVRSGHDDGSFKMECHRAVRRLAGRRVSGPHLAK